MSPIKCPSCEYRNFHPGEMCINCGAPLPSTPAARPPSPNNRPSPGQEQILDNSPFPGEERVPRNRPLPREGRSPMNKPLSRQEQILDSSPLSREERMLRNKQLSRKEPSSTNKPLSRKEPPPTNRPLSREGLSPTNKSLPREMPTLEGRPLPRKKPPATTRPISRDDLPPTNKSLPRETPTLERRSLPRKKSPAAATRPISRDDLPPTNKSLPRETPTLERGSLPRKESIARNRSTSTFEADPESKIDELDTNRERHPEEPYLEQEPPFIERPSAEDELYTEEPSSSQNNPYLADNPYLVDQSYSEQGSHSEDDSYSEEDGSQSRQLVPYQQNSPALLPNPSTALEPYQINTAMQEYLPASLLPDLSTFIKEDKQACTVPKDISELPWGLPRRDPDVEGTIIQIQQSQELPDYPNLVVGIVNMLTELIWLIPNDTMKKEEERLQITTVRIRTGNDEKKDARLIGYLRGANLTLGDEVWFWGWHRQGSLTVRKGYNWTSKAIVSTHTMGLVVPALILMILVGIGFLLYLASPSIAAGLRILR